MMTSLSPVAMFWKWLKLPIAYMDEFTTDQAVDEDVVARSKLNPSYLHSFLESGHAD